MRFATPSLRSLTRSCALYANVIAVVVALGIPGGGLRLAAGSAVQVFEGAVRAARDASAGIPDRLSRPTDLSEVTECESEAPVETPSLTGGEFSVTAAPNREATPVDAKSPERVSQEGASSAEASGAVDQGAFESLQG